MSILGPILSGAKIISDISSTLLNNSVKRDIANQNLQLQRETNAQNLALQKEAWEREDNAVSRKVADLERNGLSKTLAAGSGASSSSPIRLESPQNQFSPDKFNVDVAKAVQMSQDFALGQENINLAKANKKAVEQSAAKSKAETDLLDSQADSVELDNDLKEETLKAKILDNADKMVNLSAYGHSNPTREEKWITGLNNQLGSMWNLIPQGLQGLANIFGGSGHEFDNWYYQNPTNYVMQNSQGIVPNYYYKRKSNRYKNR